MALKDIFKKTVSVPVEEKVDPIVEQRRKEKFSTPLIYGDEFDEGFEKLGEAIKAAPTPAASTAPTSSVTKKVKTTYTPRPKMEPSYQMSEVISPIYGRKEEPQSNKAKQASTPKKKTSQKPIEDQLVPVISPIYGTHTIEEVEERGEAPVVNKRRSQRATKANKEPESVTEDLRNIASIIQEEENQLKLVEKRTGEFQFDFSNMKSEEPSLIDEIDDAMTLDELMSLYERKFKDEDK